MHYNSVFEWMSTGMEAIEDFMGTPWSSIQYEWFRKSGLGDFPGTPWMKNDAILYVESEFPLLSPNPPKDTDGRREDSGRG